MKDKYKNISLPVHHKRKYTLKTFANSDKLFTFANMHPPRESEYKLKL